MKKENLYQMKEVIKIVGNGITRRIILNYEDQGVLIPAEKDESSGYRYYSADNIVTIKSIRQLQGFGLSLKECKEYYYDKNNIEKYLKRLIGLRDFLDRNIQNLQICAVKNEDLTIHKDVLQRVVCFARRCSCTDVKDAAIKLRETYIDASKKAKIHTVLKMFTIRMGDIDSPSDLLCCIPVEDDFNGPERMEFPATNALCIYYRGPYENLGIAIKELNRYIKENNIKALGKSRSIYLEGPPQRGGVKMIILLRLQFLLFDFLIKNQINNCH